MYDIKVYDIKMYDIKVYDIKICDIKIYGQMSVSMNNFHSFQTFDRKYTMLCFN